MSLPISFSRISDQLEVAFPEVTSDLIQLAKLFRRLRVLASPYLAAREASNGNNHLDRLTLPCDDDRILEVVCDKEPDGETFAAFRPGFVENKFSRPRFARSRLLILSASCKKSSFTQAGPKFLRLESEAAPILNETIRFGPCTSRPQPCADPRRDTARWLAIKAPGRETTARRSARVTLLKRIRDRKGNGRNAKSKGPMNANPRPIDHRRREAQSMV